MPGENLQPQNPNQTTQPVQQPSPVQQQAPVQSQPVAAGKMPVKPPVRKPPNPKRLIYGVLGFFGCSIIFFIIFVLIFVAQISPTGENSLATSLGLDTASFINTLISLVNVVFGLVSIVLFLTAVVGLFKTAIARKDDKESKKNGLKLALIAGGTMVLMVFIWVGIYLFLSSKKVLVPVTGNQSSAIVTVPDNTLGLEAPVKIEFDGTKLPIDSRKYEIISFLWNFGDSETSTLQSPTYTYKNKGSNNGRFDVTLNVTLLDKTTEEEVTETYTDIVTISSIKLNASFLAIPEKGLAPLTVQFDASDSVSPEGEIVRYDWDFKNNNLFNDANGVEVEYTFEQVGTYKVNLRVTDDLNQFAVTSKEIIVEGPDLPVAVIEIPTSDGNYYSGIKYTFLAEDSFSPEGNITKYEWNFGDSSAKATTRTANHVYENSGTYDVSLTVTDENNLTKTEIKKITVKAPVGAPTATFTTTPAKLKSSDSSISGTVPFEVSFDASASSGVNSTIVDYAWDFDGDGSTDTTGEEVSYIYNDTGTYNAKLTVVDSNNKESSFILVIKVDEQGLKAEVSADKVEGIVPLTVTFDASGSSYPSGQIVSYEWDFGDGSAKRIDDANVTYKYTKIGTFQTSVTAVASDNSKSTATISVNVRPVSLTACFTPTVTQGEAPLIIEFDPACSTGTVQKYEWDFGDTQTSKIRKPTHTFDTPGSYDVTLEVSDNQNVLDTFSMQILVTGDL